MALPRIAITLGDVAGIGPEVAVSACASEDVSKACQLMLIGHPDVAKAAVKQTGSDITIVATDSPTFSDSTRTISCWNPIPNDDSHQVKPGLIDARAGNAAYHWLIEAIELAKNQQIDAITTAPLNKYALHKAEHHFPGHTEILAEQCGVDEFAMMLYLPADALHGIRDVIGRTDTTATGLGIAHVTLHTSVSSVPNLLSVEAIFDKIQLMDQFLNQIGSRKKIAVTALNPHAGEDGLFGDEESRTIKPAIDHAVAKGIDASGPFPTDTLIRRAIRGEFDGVVAMYHDQGHIPFKLIGFDRAVNVTLGLPIVRTSPSHGTAFDIAWKGQADSTGMIESILLAAKLANHRQHNQQ